MKQKWLQEEVLQTLPPSSVDSSLLLFLAQIYILGPSQPQLFTQETKYFSYGAPDLMLQYA